MQQFFFKNSVGVQSVLKFFFSIKNALDKYIKKKITFCKIFRSLRRFLELRCLVADSVDFLKLSMFINASLT